MGTTTFRCAVCRAILEVPGNLMDEGAYKPPLRPGPPWWNVVTAYQDPATGRSATVEYHVCSKSCKDSDDANTDRHRQLCKAGVVASMELNKIVEG